MAETTFTLADALNAQKALREATGEREEPLELIDLVGIGSEEIDTLLDQGKGFDEIAALIKTATGKPVTGNEVEEAFANLDDDEWDD